MQDTTTLTGRDQRFHAVNYLLNTPALKTLWDEYGIVIVGDLPIHRLHAIQLLFSYHSLRDLLHQPFTAAFP